jgi:hypothetical protein
MIYIVGTWVHVRNRTKALGMKRNEFQFVSRAQQLLALREPNVVILVTAYELSGIYHIFQEITRCKGTTWGEQDLIDGKVPR